MPERLHVLSVGILQNMHFLFLSHITSLKYCYMMLPSSSVTATQRVIYLERYLDISRNTVEVFINIDKVYQVKSSTRMPCCVANYSPTAISCISYTFL